MGGVMSKNLTKKPLYTDKMQLLERIENLRAEAADLGFSDIADMLWAARAKLQAKRIRKPI